MAPPVAARERQTEAGPGSSEYDILSATQARYERHYEHPHGLRFSRAGSVDLLDDSGRWLIAWGGPPDTATAENYASISEVDPDTGTVHFEMLIYKGDILAHAHTYRVYHRYEADWTPPPLDLPP